MTRLITRGTLAVLAAVIGIYLLLPVLVVIPMSLGKSSFLSFPPKELSLRWYRNIVEDSTWITSAGSSFQVALLSALLAVVLGTLASLALVRGNFPFRNGVIAILLAPMIVPFVIVGLAVYIAFLRMGLTQTPLGFVLIHACLGVPYVIVNVSSGLVSVDRRLEMAAMNLGAGPISTFMRITLPLILPSVLSGALFAFIISWDEVVVALFLSGPEFTTLPVRMWSGIRVQIDPTVAAISSLVIIVILLAFTLNGLSRLIQRMMTRKKARSIHAGN